MNLPGFYLLFLPLHSQPTGGGFLSFPGDTELPWGIRREEPFLLDEEIEDDTAQSTGQMVAAFAPIQASMGKGAPLAPGLIDFDSQLHQPGPSCFSSWALGPYIVLGLGIGGRAYENLNRHRQCVINLPDPTLWEQVERLAPLTGKQPVPEAKQRLGFRYCKEKFALAGLTPQPSAQVRPHRIRECPLQIEARVKAVRVPSYDGGFAIVETESVCVHAREEILTSEGYIAPTKWKPLIYNFRHYFGLGPSMGKTFRADV